MVERHLLGRTGKVYSGKQEQQQFSRNENELHPTLRKSLTVLHAIMGKCFSTNASSIRPAKCQRAYLLASAKVAGKMLNIGKAKALGYLAYR
jgi:hypothetical protein